MIRPAMFFYIASRSSHFDASLFVVLLPVGLVVLGACTGPNDTNVRSYMRYRERQGVEKGTAPADECDLAEHFLSSVQRSPFLPLALRVRSLASQAPNHWPSPAGARAMKQVRRSFGRDCASLKLIYSENARCRVIISVMQFRGQAR